MANLNAIVTGNGDTRQTLVMVFLRGGADGLNMVAPLEDPGYYKARPRIALKKNEAVGLDGFFWLHPLLKDMAPLYKDGTMAIVHAAGSEDGTRSHFEAQDLMERGGIVAGGWLGRFLLSRPNVSAGPLSAVAMGHAVPESLRGAPAATALQTFNEYSLGQRSQSFADSLGRLYARFPTPLAGAARDTLGALQRMDHIRNAAYSPANGAVYDWSEFSQDLKRAAQLIKARVGLEALCVDLNGWDTHTGQYYSMNPLMTQLTAGLTAFCRDMGREMQSVTVVVMTEFGRRLAENSAFGTDHGRGSVMFVLGGGVRGGRVITKWPGLTDDVLEGPGDLPVTINYRDVLAPILQKHSPTANMRQVFPNFALKPLDVYG